MLGIAILATHEDVVTVLQNIPGITWKAKVYDNMFSYSTKPIQKLQFTQPANTSADTTDPLPDHWDWTQKRPDCMNVVSNIGMCSVSGLVSSANIISDMRCLKNLDQPRVEYSAQFMLNCDTQYKAPLCDDMPVQPNGWTFLIDNGTVPESCVSYQSGKTGKTGKCPVKCDDQSKLPNRTHIKSVLFICNFNDPENEQRIMRALINGPVQTRIQVTQDLNYYESGIYQYEYGAWVGWTYCEFVGYGEENGVKFWKVKNERGTDWGENGFFRIIRGTKPGGENDIESECYQAVV
ncbi:Cathepsin_B [Hexamita inflata]|uniref:Cathepsin B n=1 Tax=Hexamita inflata TaxID=28002 RepID=A0AA86NU14_9EUKA|nr:Cathepsin B [Hexamita inflata]